MGPDPGLDGPFPPGSPGWSVLSRDDDHWGGPLGDTPGTITHHAALRLPTIGRPVRYLARVLISDPLSAAMEPMIVRAVEESPVLREIDRAVNTRDPGSPTMSDDVARMSSQVDELVETVTEIGGRLQRGDARFDVLSARIEEVAEAICPDD